MAFDDEPEMQAFSDFEGALLGMRRVMDFAEAEFETRGDADKGYELKAAEAMADQAAAITFFLSRWSDLQNAADALGLAVAMIDNLRHAGDPDKAVRLTVTGQRTLEVCRDALIKVRGASASPSDGEG